MRVLIVEDDPVSALVLRKVLEAKGLRVDRAENGVQAIEMVQLHHHRIVISDWMMPEMDGVELCRHFRSTSGSYVYVILLSAKSQRDDRLIAFEAGVDDFLTKPLDRDELFARLKVAQRILETEENLQLQKAELEVAGEQLQLANSNLVLASRRFEELFSGLPVACFTFDGLGQIHEWNREAVSLFGIPPHETLLRPVHAVFENSGFWSPDLVDTVFTGTVVNGREWTYTDRSGAKRYLVCNVFPLLGPGGEILGAISVNTDITLRKLAEEQVERQMDEIAEQKAALQEANARLELLAVTDGLTGLWNHRRFQEALEKEFTAHRRLGSPMSVIMLDVDHFKGYNDAYGHPAGDQVLKSVAETLQEACREHETVARYGGEEFAVILSGADREGALAAGERFRQAIESHVFPHRAVTVSVGVASDSPAVERAKQLLERADEALYASKQAGRNRVTSYGEGAPATVAA